MRVAFVSCTHINGRSQKTQPIWSIIRNQKPDLLLMLGDNVYLGPTGYSEGNLTKKMAILKKEYNKQMAEPHFNGLLNAVPFLAVWDNHDFGLPGHKFEPEHDKVFGPGEPNPSGEVATYGADVSQEFRTASTAVFNEKFKSHPKSLEPPAPVIYCTHTIEEFGKKVKFFMVDVRSMQDDPTPDLGFPPVRPSHPLTLLGHDQEVWLLKEIKNSRADINVICSGIPYAYWQKYESWATEFEKAIAKKDKVLFLGGQIHHNKFIIHPDPENAGKPNTFYEAVSSGVGHTFHRIPIPNNNAELIGNPSLLYKARNNYGIIDFTEDRVIVTLYGQSADDMHYAVIRRRDWKLEGKFSMQKTHPHN